MTSSTGTPHAGGLRSDHDCRDESTSGMAQRLLDHLRQHGLPPVGKPHQLSVWSVVLWLLLVDVLWAMLAGFRVTLASIVSTLVVVATFMSPLLLRRMRARLGLRETLLTLGGMLVFAPVSMVLSYLIVALAPPMVDSQLAAIDAALGFDWAAVTQWVHAHPWLDQLFWWSYRSAILQILVLVIVLGATGRHRQLREFNALFIIGGIFCILFSALTPAFGPWHAAPAAPFDASVMSHIDALRNGDLRLVDLGKMQGLVSMPSFHTMGAVFVAYSMRGVRGWAPLYVVLNLLVIASTPTEGGHYLTDVLAGGCVALAMIALSRSEFLSPKKAPHAHARVAAR
jgi:membrane-associated phospholipid phosphatase